MSSIRGRACVGLVSSPESSQLDRDVSAGKTRGRQETVNALTSAIALSTNTPVASPRLLRIIFPPSTSLGNGPSESSNACETQSACTSTIGIISRISEHSCHEQRPRRRTELTSLEPDLPPLQSTSLQISRRRKLPARPAILIPTQSENEVVLSERSRPRVDKLLDSSHDFRDRPCTGERDRVERFTVLEQVDVRVDTLVAYFQFGVDFVSITVRDEELV